MESIEIFPDNLVESEPQQIKKTLLVLRWLGLIFLIAALLFGCSWISLYGTRSTPSMDTGSLLKADYSPWDFLVFQPVDLLIMDEIENDKGEPVLDPKPKTGNLGLVALTTPVRESLTDFTTNTPINVPSSSATPSPIGSAGTPPETAVVASTETAMATPIPTSTNTSAPAITNTLAPTITNKPANTNTPKPAKTKKPKPTRNPNYTPNP